jgi:hypothetical protein
MTFYTRNMVGLKPPNTQKLAVRTGEPVGITWHWTGSGGNLYRPDPLNRLKAIQAYHMGNGYGDIAYHGAFDADGNLYALRENKYVGAHAASVNGRANQTTLGIVFLEDSRGFTKKAAQAMTACNALFESGYGHDADWYTHHYWLKNTECCGAQLRAFVKFCGGFD